METEVEVRIAEELGARVLVTAELETRVLAAEELGIGMGTVDVKVVAGVRVESTTLEVEDEGSSVVLSVVEVASVVAG